MKLELLVCAILFCCPITTTPKQQHLLAPPLKSAIQHKHDYVRVADFNFDGLDDLAVRNGFELNIANGFDTPVYNFYLQTQDEKFAIDSFLTTTMKYFPTEIDSKRLLLKTVVSYLRYDEITIYTLDKKRNLWTSSEKRVMTMGFPATD